MSTTTRSPKRPLVRIALALLLLFGASTAAYAYWTNSGTGTGTGATGTNTAITVKQTSTISNLRPGGAAITLSGNFDNGNDGPVYVSQVTVGTITVTKATGAPAGTCDATDYTVTGSPMTVNAQVPAGTAQGSWTGATIQFNNKSGSNQDGCKGATLSIAYTSS